jgi:hypothetical protein
MSRLGCGDLTPAQGFRVVRRTKDAEWVERHGQEGIDLGILLERALVSALELAAEPTSIVFAKAQAEAMAAAQAAQEYRRGAREEYMAIATTMKWYGLAPRPSQ